MPSSPCPNCGHLTARLVDFPSHLAIVNYYRCETCGHIWTTEKDGSVPVHHVTPLDGPDKKT